MTHNKIWALSMLNKGQKVRHEEWDYNMYIVENNEGLLEDELGFLVTMEDFDCDEGWEFYDAKNYSERVYKKIVELRNQHLDLAGDDTNSCHFIISHGMTNCLRILDDVETVGVGKSNAKS